MALFFLLLSFSIQSLSPPSFFQHSKINYLSPEGLFYAFNHEHNIYQFSINRRSMNNMILSLLRTHKTLSKTDIQHYHIPLDTLTFIPCPEGINPSTWNHIRLFAHKEESSHVFSKLSPSHKKSIIEHLLNQDQSSPCHKRFRHYKPRIHSNSKVVFIEDKETPVFAINEFSIQNSTIRYYGRSKWKHRLENGMVKFVLYEDLKKLPYPLEKDKTLHSDWSHLINEIIFPKRDRKRQRDLISYILNHTPKEKIKTVTPISIRQSRQQEYSSPSLPPHTSTEFTQPMETEQEDSSSLIPTLSPTTAPLFTFSPYSDVENFLIYPHCQKGYQLLLTPFLDHYGIPTHPTPQCQNEALRSYLFNYATYLQYCDQPSLYSETNYLLNTTIF